MSSAFPDSGERRSSKRPWMVGLLVAGVLIGGGVWVWNQNQEEPLDEEEEDVEVNPNDTAPPDSRAETEEHLRSIGYVQ